MFFATTQSPLNTALRRTAFVPGYTPAYAARGRTIERMLDEALHGARQQGVAYTQNETAFTLTLDVPGIAKEQLSIAIEGAVVRVNSRDGVERKYRAAYELPQDIDSSQSQAKLEHGVLTLTLVKKVPVSNATELAIQ